MAAELVAVPMSIDMVLDILDIFVAIAVAASGWTEIGLGYVSTLEFPRGRCWRKARDFVLMVNCVLCFSSAARYME
jgi:hypothetical protein